ncbi:MAG: hypothetical protein GY810_02520 [Aureispira sp.]|nr:hypothetical protein [Aureispira sp.]
MGKKYSIVVGLMMLCAQVALGQEWSTISYGIRSAIKTNTIYDIHFSSDSLLYIASAKGLWQYNGLEFTEIPIANGESMNGSYLREPQAGQIYMQDFNGQLYLQIDDSLYLQTPPKEIGVKIIAIHLGEDYIYYINGKKIFVYSYDGQQKSMLTYPNGSFNEFVSINGVVGMILSRPGKTKLMVSAQVKDETLKVYDEEWSFNFEHQFQNQRLIKDQVKRQLYTPDQSLLIDWSKCSQEITPRLVRRISNTTLVGCVEGLYIPNSNRLMLKGKYITDILKDHEGNIWVATLNKGLHKLISLKSYFYPIDNDEKAVHLIHKKGDQLIYADIGSNVYRYNGEVFESFFKSPKKSYPKNLYFDSLHNVYVFSGGYLQTFSSNLEPLIYQGSYGKLVKDSNGYAFNKFRIGGRCLYAKLEDFYTIQKHLKSKNLPQTRYTSPHYKNVLYNGKINSIVFKENFKSEDTYKWKNQLIYHYKDTLYYDNVDSPQVGYQVPIHSRFEKVSVINSRVYVQTGDSLLEFNLKAERVNATPRTNGLSQTIEFLSGDDKYLCVTTFDAVHVLDIATLKPLYKFTPQNGIASIDFNKAWVYDGLLYINGSQGITEITLGEQYYAQGSPSVTLDAVYIDGELMSGNQFSYQQNNLKINLKLRSFTANGKLHWRLNNNDWRTQEEFKQIRLDGLQYGNYNLEVYWLNDLGAQSKVLKYEFVIHKPYWLQWWFLLSTLGGSLGLALIWYIRRMRQLKLRNELENNLIASQMTALKSQMNPHFIFNALNSIQSLIVYQRTNEAFDYVDKFSVLLRQILNFSDQDFIPLNEEIDMLRNYLDMEKMRFDGNLGIEIKPCEDTNVQIPSMIIQPFVENAIKHGLLHKTTGQKVIKIRFELLNDDTLICEVFDNGIGRKAAQALQSENKRFGKSFSTNATQKRLELLQKVQLKRLGIEYSDLEDAEGNALGTKVRITIPIE